MSPLYIPPNPPYEQFTLLHMTSRLVWWNITSGCVLRRLQPWWNGERGRKRHRHTSNIQGVRPERAARNKSPPRSKGKTPKPIKGERGTHAGYMWAKSPPQWITDFNGVGGSSPNFCDVQDFWCKPKQGGVRPISSNILFQWSLLLFHFLYVLDILECGTAFY